MNLQAFAIAIVIILVVLLILAIALLVAESVLERNLVNNGYPADKCKRPVKSMFKKKDAEGTVQTSEATEEGAPAEEPQAAPVEESAPEKTSTKNTYSSSYKKKKK